MKSNLLLMLVCPMLLVSCSREASDSASIYPRFTGTAPWTIAGIRPGLSLDDVKKLKGEPARAFGNPPLEFAWDLRSPPGTLTVRVDSSGRVKAVFGNSLSAGDRVLVGASASDDEVKAILGAGESHKMKSAGSFVLPTPSKQFGTEHYYQNGDATFRVIVMKDQGLTGIVAEQK